MLDFIIIYIISTLILIEVCVIYYYKPWSVITIKFAFLPIINTIWIIVGLFIAIGLYLYKFIKRIKEN